MLHLGTGGGVANHKEVITPQQIAQGKGDSYLVALNHAIASWGKAIYVRPLAEMNNFNTFYGGYNENGTPRGADRTPAVYRQAFQRIYVILHGGTIDQVNAKLRSLGLPAVQGTELFPNPFPQLRARLEPARDLAAAGRRQRGHELLPRQRVRRRRWAATSTT